MPRVLFAFLVLLSSCVYVTKAEFDEYWDADGDGWPLGEDCNDGHAEVFCNFCNQRYEVSGSELEKIHGRTDDHGSS